MKVQSPDRGETLKNGRVAMIGHSFGPYRIEALSGSGSLSHVYRGVRESDGRPVAIKVFKLKIEDHEQRFRRIVEILDRFQHPNVVRALGSGRISGVHYLAMEYIGGPSLQEILADRQVMPWPEVVALGIPIAEALQYIHDQGVIHQHLKPSHFKMTENGQIKLVGFGLARSIDRPMPLQMAGRIVGNPAYMSPEQVMGKEVTYQTDLYAMGTVFYRMLTGEPPYSGMTSIEILSGHIGHPPRRPSEQVGSIPKALDDLIVSMMAKAPADRPVDAAQIFESLAKLRASPVKNEIQGPLDGRLDANVPSKGPNGSKLRAWFFRTRDRPDTPEIRPIANPDHALWDQELDG